MEFLIFQNELFGSVSDRFELNNGTRREEALLDNPAELGIISGLLATACIFNLKVNMLKEDFFEEPTLYSQYQGFKAMFHFVLNLVCFCIFLPFILSSLVLLCAYRYAITLTLKIQLREKFVGLLEGTDSLWAVEDVSCKSVINVLATLEVTPHTSTDELMEKLRNLAQRKLIVRSDARLDKLSCLRKKKYGYFYWERCDSVDITKHMRWLGTNGDMDSSNEKPNEEESFNKMFSKICTRPLPHGNQASWEILVSRNHLPQHSYCFKAMEEGFISHNKTNNSRNNVRIPIIFRLHHTLGDGFALFRLLLATIADSPEDVEIAFEQKIIKNIPSEVTVFRDKTLRNGLSNDLSSFNAEQQIILNNSKYLIGASMPFSLMFNVNLKETVEKYVATKFRKFVSSHEFGKAFFDFAVTRIKESTELLVNVTILRLSQIIRVTLVLIGMPNFLIRQAARSMDKSTLHGPKLSGKKIISSWIEDDSGKNIGHQNLLAKIQNIKNATGTRFSDVILAALSASLHNYFKQIGESVPRSLTVVLPTQMSVSDGDLSLSNEFSVGLLPLSISGTNKDPSIMERLFDVARSSHQLRGEPDYLVNLWVMKWLLAALPEVVLRVVLESHSTLVFSNVPGPREVQILCQKLRNIVFWVPQRGSTGIGFSALSYGGNMNFGLIADKALIQNNNLLTGILENTVQEIDNLHDIIFMSHLSKFLQNMPTASTNTKLECCE